MAHAPPLMITEQLLRFLRKRTNDGNLAVGTDTVAAKKNAPFNSHPINLWEPFLSNMAMEVDPKNEQRPFRLIN